MEEAVEVVPFSAAIVEFIEALIHQILYLRAIYDPQIFDRHKLYNIAIRKAIHPGVVAYVSNLTRSLKAGIASGAVNKIVILLLDSKHRGIEKFVVDVKVVAPGKTIRPTELQAALRSVLVKVSMMEAHLWPLPPGCTFTVLACTCDGHDTAVIPEDLWVEEGNDKGGLPGQEATVSAVAQTKSRLSLTFDGTHEIVPIKSTCISNALKLQLHVDTCMSLNLRRTSV